MINLFTNPIKKEILEQIKKNDGIFYGDLVQNLNHTNRTILKHLIDLKQQGLVLKDDDGGKFKLV